MSYARWGWGSDVYVFFTGDWIECCGCDMVSEEISTFQAYSTGDMVKHLWEHENKGDIVPPDIYDLLWLDNEENFGKA